MNDGILKIIPRIHVLIIITCFGIKQNKGVIMVRLFYDAHTNLHISSRLATFSYFYLSANVLALHVYLRLDWISILDQLWLSSRRASKLSLVESKNSLKLPSFFSKCKKDRNDSKSDSSNCLMMTYYYRHHHHHHHYHYLYQYSLKNNLFISYLVQLTIWLAMFFGWV